MSRLAQGGLVRKQEPEVLAKSGTPQSGLSSPARRSREQAESQSGIRVSWEAAELGIRGQPLVPLARRSLAWPSA